MFRSLFKSAPQSNRSKSIHSNVKTETDTKLQASLSVEPLEERLMLSWVGFFDGITLELEQTGDDGDVVIDNSGIGGAFRVTDNADSLTFVDAQNVVVRMLEDTANQLNFNVNTGHTGNVELHLNHGPRDLFFTGTFNQIGGDLTVTAGDGPQFVNLSPLIPFPIVTGGSATFELGDGFDTVYNNENFVTIGGDLNMVGVNLFRYTDFLFPVPLDADLKVGGNMLMDTSNESTESFLLEGGTWHDPDPDVNERSIISGNFTYIGGDDIDHVNLNDTYIVGDVTIDLGDGIPFFGDPQNVTTTLTPPFPLFPYAQIDGNISITTGDSNLGNVITLDGLFNGDTVTFDLGDLNDTVNYGLLGTQADITATMGGGNDIFELRSGVNVLDIDFGNDLGDEFINNFGQFNFDSDITNFHFFDHLYTVGDDTLVMNQLFDVGDIIIDNDGGPVTEIDWRLTTALGGVGSTTPADNLIVNMLDNTGNIEVDLVNPVLAFLTVNMGDGDRLLEFTGASNNPLRDMIVNAGAGEQHVELSVNAPLAVASLNINLGSDFDSVDDDANNLIITEDLIFTGVNHFVNDGVLSVARHAVIDTQGESENTVFANNSSFFVNGQFTYRGGNGRDELSLNGADLNRFNLTVDIDLGDNINGGDQFALMNGANTLVGLSLDVLSSNSGSQDIFELSTDATLGTSVSVDLGHGPNDAIIVGSINGNQVDYTGGSGVDNVIFGTTGTPVFLTVNLGSGNDNFTLLANADINDNLFIDFGGGTDIFNNLKGTFDFSAMLLNLNGFSHVYDFPSDSMTSTQVSDPGPVVVDNNGISNSIRFIDGGVNVLTTVTNLTIDMLDNSGTDMDIQLDNALAGNLAVNLGDGNRTLNLTGTSNDIGGLLSITGGTGSQDVGLANNSHLNVAGSVFLDLGSGSDTVEESGNNIDIGGNLLMVGVNLFENDGIMNVLGDVSVNNSFETQQSVFDNNATMAIGGDFSYQGNSATDNVDLSGAGGTMIGGNADVHVGANSTGGSQTISFDSANSSVDGLLDVSSTENNRVDNFFSNAGTFFGDDITVNLGGGTNNAEIFGQFTGSKVTYVGGDQADDVMYATTGGDANVNIILGKQNDKFTLGAGADIDPLLRVDFGGGIDTFINNFGNFTFDANLVNWNGFDRFYDHSASLMRINQVMDLGNFVIDNNGLNDAMRIISGGVTEMTPANDLRVTLLSNSTSNVTLDLDNALAGDLVLNLKNGSRLVRFVGDANDIGGFLRIEGGVLGTQDVHLAVNADLNVTESLVINLRNGVDLVEDNSNSIFVGTNLILRSVNTFRVDNTLDVGGNFTVNTTFDNEESVVDSNGVTNIAGNMTYLGGNQFDRVFMNNATIGGNANVELGSGNEAQHADFRGADVARIRVTGESSNGGNHFKTDAGTNVAGDVAVRFIDTITTNTAVFQGTYGGTYGTYRGGMGFDNITFGANAALMNFVTRLGDSNDRYTLQTGTDLLQGLLDFGNGVDTFDDEIGEPYPFPFNVINLN